MPGGGGCCQADRRFELQRRDLPRLCTGHLRRATAEAAQHAAVGQQQIAVNELRQRESRLVGHQRLGRFQRARPVALSDQAVDLDQALFGNSALVLGHRDRDGG